MAWTSKPPASLTRPDDKVIWRRVFGKATPWWEKPAGRREWGPGYTAQAVAFDYRGYQPGVPTTMAKASVYPHDWSSKWEAWHKEA